MSRCVTVGAVLIATACHSDAFGPEHYGPQTTLTTGAESRLTFNPGDRYGNPFHAVSVSWGEDGIGIVYVFGPREYQPGELTVLRCNLGQTCVPVSRDPGDTCVGFLPPDGGSANWQFCETRQGHTDSIDVISEPAVGRDGLLRFTETTTNNFGFAAHTERWVVDPHDVAGRRRVLNPADDLDSHSPNCTRTACVTLTVSGAPRHWDIWRVDLSSGDSTLLRSFAHQIDDARVSPTSGRIVTLEQGNLYLLDLVVQ